MTSPTTETTTSSERARHWIVAGAMVLAPVLLLIGSLFEIDTGDEGGVAELTAVAADRGQFYASGVLIALGLSMLAVCALGLMHLSRARGGVLGTIGGCFLFVGGTAAGAAIFMYSAVVHLASSDDLDRAAMGEFSTAAEDSMQIGLPFMVGFVSIAIGLLLLGIALWRAGTVPRWVAAIVSISGISSWFAEDSATTIITTSSLFALVGCAVELVRRDRTIVLPDVPAQAAPADPGVASTTSTVG